MRRNLELVTKLNSRYLLTHSADALFMNEWKRALFYRDTTADAASFWDSGRLTTLDSSLCMHATMDFLSKVHDDEWTENISYMCTRGEEWDPYIP